MKKMIFIFLFLIFLKNMVIAHPHVFIETRADFVFQKNVLRGITVIWKFDMLFSNRVIMQCDLNRDKKFNAQEIAKVFKGFFFRLKHYNYFTHIWINNVYKGHLAVSNFKAVINNDRRVTYKFFITINNLAGINKKILKLMYKDKTNFVAFYAVKKSFKIKGAKAGSVKAFNNKRAQYQLEY